MLAEGGLADAELPRQQHGADAVPHEIAIDLGREMPPGSFNHSRICRRRSLARARRPRWYRHIAN